MNAFYMLTINPEVFYLEKNTKDKTHITSVAQKEINLLKSTGHQFCLFCHDSGDVFKNEVHEDLDDSECTLCHNPHGGEDRFILN